MSGTPVFDSMIKDLPETHAVFDLGLALATGPEIQIDTENILGIILDEEQDTERENTT